MIIFYVLIYYVFLYIHYTCIGRVIPIIKPNEKRSLASDRLV